MTRFTEEWLQKRQSISKGMAKGMAVDTKPRHKFNAKPQVNDGIRFDSKLEARYYEHLKLLKHQGEVLFFLRQVPVHLRGGTKLIIDFQVFKADGTVQMIDVKGTETPEFKIKKREVEAVYPFEITVIKKGEF